MTEGQVSEISKHLEETVDESKGESAIMYAFSGSKYVNRIIVGSDPTEDDQFI